jgi:beta-glucosidase
MKRSARLTYVFAFLSFYSVHAQQSDFISATASASPSEAAFVMDGNKQTAWHLAAGGLSQDQSLTLALRVPGNVQQLTIDATGLSAQLLKKMLGIYITYDPMNPGPPVDFTIAGNGPFTLTFPARYGAHIKLLFKGGLTRRPIAIREVYAASADTDGGATDRGATASRDTAGKPWMNPKMPLDQRVETLLSVMTPAQKMELLREGWGIPGIPSLGIPDMKKVEAIHGFSYGSGATIFPQSIALGATWDKTLVEKVADAIGDETVSAGAVQAWSPVLDVAQDPRWGRCEETYGEDPILVSEIGGAWIKGYQSRGLIVTPKHFAVHGAVLGGRDSHDMGLSEREIREIHLVPFRNIIEKYHCQSMMMAYSDFEGVPVAKSKELLKGILREEWGFDGFIVSDCGAIGNLSSRKHYTARDPVEAANEALAAGIATNCGDTYNNPSVIAAAKDGTLNKENLDYTCRTLLRTMFRNGYFEHNPSRQLDWNKIYPGWNSPEHKAIARQAAREAIVLLENKDNILPLPPSAKTIAVIGPGADDLQPGDYTPKLQPGQLISVLSGIRAAAGAGVNVLYEQGCDFAWGTPFHPDAALAAAAKADIVVMVLGDCSTSESAKNIRQTSGEGRDYASLVLPGDQEKLLEAVCGSGKPVILVLQSGRPYDLSYAAAHCKAILVNWLPGQEGGPATADVLFGAYNPAGRLPMTFPRNAAQLPLYYNFKTSGRGYDYVDMPFHPLYPFGFGLSYTSFSYSDLTAVQNTDGTVAVSATVTNTGRLKGDEVAQLYVTDLYASVKTRVMELKDFQRVTLAPGEFSKVSFTLSPYQLSLLNDNMDRVVEAGEFKIMVGGKSPSYIAADKIKNSVGFKTPAEGVNATLDYTASGKADFSLSPGDASDDPILHKKRIPVTVTNNGNLTDIGKLTMYLNGQQAGDVHHFELAPGASTVIWFVPDGTGEMDISFTTKYKLASRHYMLNAQSGPQQAKDSPFTGEKTAWHDGFDRYDFLMDEQTMAITPIKATEDEHYGAKPAEKGKLRCIVIVPQKVAAGNPWSWRGCYWDHEPQTEVELLKRGFHIAFIMCDPDAHWDAWYNFLTQEHGLSKKPAFIGMSKGGINEFAWATVNPDKVSCIYADNPALRLESFSRLSLLAKHDIPLLHVCGSYDFLLQQHTLAVEDAYHRLGGRISLVIKEGPGHHPHSLRDPTLVAGWIEENSRPGADESPAIPGLHFDKSYYYSYADTYRYCKPEDTYATCRGPLFTDTYERYDVNTGSDLGITGMTILVPKKPAPGNPWVFKADRIGRAAEPVDLALLAKGFYIVAAPVTAQAGPQQEQWDECYRQLTALGLSHRPVMEGAGAGGGEAYYWAIHNPEKVSCIYAENPVLRSLQAKAPLADSLAPLAKAGVPILHVCGSLDPWYPVNTREVEKKYRQLGGQMKVMLKEGEGHFGVLPRDLTTLVDYITASQH